MINGYIIISRTLPAKFSICYTIKEIYKKIKFFFSSITFMGKVKI